MTTPKDDDSPSPLKRAASRLAWPLAAALALGALAATPVVRQALPSLAEQRTELLRLLAEVHGLEPFELAAVARIFESSPVLGQGNPAVTEHPMTPEECLERRKAAGQSERSTESEAICGAPFMVPLYDPRKESPREAKACIDQFEFPNVPCTYPVVWVKASEAAGLCSAMGKRLCDAHEWEGGCAGALEPPDYRFDLARTASPDAAVSAMRRAHNASFSPTKNWSYGAGYADGVCAAASHKTPGCNGGSWRHCGSNTYPTGAFPQCKSALGVFDVHGNAAEHMNLPLTPEQMTSRGSKELGVTEMKGSWFIFDAYQAHEDWCRWRAPYWHGTRVLSAGSHANYHLGFRCCKTVDAE